MMNINELKTNLKTNNQVYYGAIEKDNKMYEIIAEQVGDVYVFFVCTLVPQVKQNGEYYSIEFIPEQLGTGTDVLTQDSINKTIDYLIKELSEIIKEKYN